MLKTIVVSKSPARTVRTEALALFADRTRTLEGHVNQLLQLAGWTEKRMGCAAKGEFYIAKFGDIQGEHIGLWSSTKFDCEVASWPVTQTAKSIVEAILALTGGVLPADQDLAPKHPLHAYMQ